MTRPRPAIERLLARCEEDGDGCWIYQGRTDVGGYCHINVGRGRSTVGHRVAWEFFVGEIPDGLTYDHLCRKPACVNPWHGDLVPIGVNVLRGNTITGVNKRKTHCPKGHPYDGDNLILRKKGDRICRECARASSLAYVRRVRPAAREARRAS